MFCSATIPSDSLNPKIFPSGGHRLDGLRTMAETSPTGIALAVKVAATLAIISQDTGFWQAQGMDSLVADFRPP